MFKSFKFPVVFLALAAAVAAFSFAERFRPVSASDKAKIEDLLKAFDPNSFALELPYLDGQGKVRKQNMGRAKGLASLVQSNTQRVSGGGSNAVIPMVTVSAKGHVLANNGVIIAKEGFGKPGLASKIRELNTILKKYTIAQ